MFYCHSSVFHSFRLLFFWRGSILVPQICNHKSISVFYIHFPVTSLLISMLCFHTPVSHDSISFIRIPLFWIRFFRHPSVSILSISDLLSPYVPDTLFCSILSDTHLYPFILSSYDLASHLLISSS